MRKTICLVIKAMIAVLLIVFLCILLGCSDKGIPTKEEPTETSDNQLIFGGAVIIATSDSYQWTHQSGVILFVIAFNTSLKYDWYGYPELQVREIGSLPSDGKKGLISKRQGVLTTRVDRVTFVPTDEKDFIPADSELETLTFAPVDWTEYRDGVWVYWGFVPINNLNKETTDETAGFAANAGPDYRFVFGGRVGQKGYIKAGKEF